MTNGGEAFDVLLAAGDDGIAQAIGSPLALRGHRLHRCVDAEKAWDLYRTHLYPLVVLDAAFPRLCREIRRHPQGRRSFLLSVTSPDRPADAQAALEAGADDFLAVPSDATLVASRLSVIERRVRELLEAARTQDALLDARSDLERHFLRPRATLAPALGILEEQITERKRAELTSTRLLAALESAGEAVLITDGNGTIEYVNRAFERMTGWAAADAVGKNPRILKSGRHDASFYRELWSAISSGQVWHREFTNKKRSGETYEVEQTISPIRDSAGRTIGFVGVQQDISDRKRDETVKSAPTPPLPRAFAHDLKTPLGAVLGYAELLKDRAAEAQRKDDVADLERLEAAARRLLGLIEEFARKLFPKAGA